MRWRVITVSPPILSSPCSSMHADCVRHLRAGPETPICRGQVGTFGPCSRAFPSLAGTARPFVFEDTHA